MRALFVVPPLVGHINPAVSVAAELSARGHDVAWVGITELIDALAGSPQRVFSEGIDPSRLTERDAKLVGPAALKYLWEELLIPLAVQMAPAVRRAFAEFAPDIVIADQQAFAGSLLAHDAGLPYVTSATTSAELIDPLEGMPKVAEWVAEQLALVRSELNVAAAHSELNVAAAQHDPRFSPHGIIAFTTAEFCGEIARTEPVTFVGPALNGRIGDALDIALDPSRPVVLVSLGTANDAAGQRFLNAAFDAATAHPQWQTVIADPGGALDGRSEPNIVVRQRVPQLALLSHCAAVVCHGGHNTVCESLRFGVPLVVAPIRDDQPVIAAQVVDAGAGIRVRFGRAGAQHIGDAVEQVLSETYRAAAARIGAGFASAGGASAAADVIESVAGNR